MEESNFILARNKIIGLFWYFGILLMVGMALSIFCLTQYGVIKKLSITIMSLIGGAGTALLGSAIFYLRKLYKSSINDILSEPSDRKDKLKEIGIFYYYLLRPIFAVTFSVVFHIALKASVSFVTVTETNLTEGMIYLTMIISFFLGFGAGDVLTRLEDYSKGIVKKTLNRF